MHAIHTPRVHVGIDDTHIHHTLDYTFLMITMHAHSTHTHIHYVHKNIYTHTYPHM